ncbi:MAG: bifunctional demethylmenaquinone methyltransferase/2-methoxy-6-polyprenyl-1,4-benzoquinol methylase UbiE [Bacteroidetes bacterium]|nr:bifunctional demethylmenaquinone methyltransferase/2-methoxy-6-polyprenyl-1,4-benzoquinol methylase UbiE [Bacteroidota bacterium]
MDIEILMDNKELQHNKILPFQESAENKKTQVAEMFNQIAIKYDFLNHILSFNIDKLWRKKAIQKLEINKPKIILDVATGTADFAIVIEKILKPEIIIGIDISEKMLEVGKKKIEELNLSKTIKLEIGDCEKLNFEENYFDAVTVAFGVRNFEKLINGLNEIKKVLKPNGVAVILEFSKPKNLIIKLFYKFYLNILVPFIGKMFSKNKEAYSYLNKSVQAFPEEEVFLKILKEINFKNISATKLSFGIATIYTAQK